MGVRWNISVAFRRLHIAKTDYCQQKVASAPEQGEHFTITSIV